MTKYSVNDTTHPFHVLVKQWFANEDKYKQNIPIFYFDNEYKI